MDFLIETIANVGFPIGISIYLLIRIEGKLENLTTSIEKLSQTIVEKWNKIWNLPRLRVSMNLLFKK